jgi:hypothetical protein
MPAIRIGEVLGLLPVVALVEAEVLQRLLGQIRPHGYALQICWLMAVSPKNAGMAAEVVSRYRCIHATTLNFDAQYGVSSGMAAQELLFQTGVDGASYVINYNLQPWVREMLVAHPDILLDATPPRTSPRRSR